MKRYVYYKVTMRYDHDFSESAECDSLDEALLYINKRHRVRRSPLDGTECELLKAEVTKVAEKTVYEFIKNAE